jgi:hypothetical protein
MEPSKKSKPVVILLVEKFSKYNSDYKCAVPKITLKKKIVVVNFHVQGNMSLGIYVILFDSNFQAAFKAQTYLY